MGRRQPAHCTIAADFCQSTAFTVLSETAHPCLGSALTMRGFAKGLEMKVVAVELVAKLATRSKTTCLNWMKSSSWSSIIAGQGTLSQARSGHGPAGLSRDEKPQRRNRAGNPYWRTNGHRLNCCAFRPEDSRWRSLRAREQIVRVPRVRRRPSISGQRSVNLPCADRAVALLIATFAIAPLSTGRTSRAPGR